MATWIWIIIIIVLFIAGLGIGFYLAQKFIKAQMRKNPPINEAMIRSLYSQVGRTPTESQVKLIMNKMMKNFK